MTITSTTVRTTLDGDDETAFDTAFKFIRNADLRVSVLDAEGAETVWEEGDAGESDKYTVTGAGLVNGGTVTFGTAVPDGSTVLIINDPDLTQLTDYVSGDPFPAESHEAALDLLTVQNQRTRDMQITAGGNLVVDGGTVKLSGSYPDGGGSTVIGRLAGNGLDSCDLYNVLVGYRAGYSLDAAHNVYVGGDSGSGATSGTNNTGIGRFALQGAAASTQAQNVGVGSSAAKALSDGSKNVALGMNSLLVTTSGDDNIAIGHSAGSGLTTQNKNILIGTGVGTTTTGADSILVIDDGDQSGSDKDEKYFIYGDMANGTFRMNASSNLTSNQFTINNWTVATGGGSILRLNCENNGATTFNYIECGAESTPAAEVFKVRGDGAVYSDADIYGTPADYADMFEWSDGNPDAEDRIGLSVVLDGEGGVQPATISDNPADIVGIVSGTACMVGNAAWSKWDKQFLKDDFGRRTDDVNPDFDESMEYVPRQDRPEWAIIGLTGRIHLRTGSPTHPSWRKIRTVSAVTEEWLVR